MTFSTQIIWRIVVLIAATCECTVSLGHGHPILVTADSSNRLVVSGAVMGAEDGYADQIFVETDSSGDPQDFGDFANFGSAVYWIVPGFEITGLSENTGLYLEPIARPASATKPVDSRTLWYWNPNSAAIDKVESAPASSRLQIRRSASVNALLTPTTTVAPPAIKIADPVFADMNFHNHDLVRYLLPFPLPDEGAYAFFARLKSDFYQSSDPFLVVMNNGGLEGPDMLDAARDINRNALLAGDYNHDDGVDAGDYVLWRNSLNSTSFVAADGSRNGVVDAADLDIWKANFGLSFPSAGSGTNGVPEPMSVFFLLELTAFMALGRPSRF
jgi:hypothetical protein